MISTQFCEKTGEFQEVESSTQSENHCDVVVKVENVISTQFYEKTGEFQEVIVINPDSIPGTGKSFSEALLFVEHGENMLCTKIVLNVRNNFCTQHVPQV